MFVLHSYRRQDESRLRATVAKLRQQQHHLQSLQKQEQTWSALPNSSSMEPMKIGALTREDDEWLEQEYVSTIPVKAPQAQDLAAGQD